MGTNRLWKNFAGRRCDQKALRQCFLAQPDGLHGLGRALAVASTVFQPPDKSASIRVHPRLKTISGFGVRDSAFADHGRHPAEKNLQMVEADRPALAVRRDLGLRQFMREDEFRARPLFEQLDGHL